MTRITAPLLAVSLFALAACGGNGKSSTTAPANADVTVRARAALSFDQPSYTAAAKDGKVVIALINDSSLPHTLHVIDGDGKNVDPSSPRMRVSGSGDEASGTFALPAGNYHIVCTVPGHNGMNSTLTVTD